MAPPEIPGGVQGGLSGCTLCLVDIKLRVVFLNKEGIRTVIELMF